MRPWVTHTTEYFSATTSGCSEETSMYSASGPVASLSGGQLSFCFWDFGIGSGPNSSANFDVQTGSLIDELEWVRTVISSLDGWNFFESRGSEGNAHCYRKFRCVACA